jgi:hypothetical protein
MSLRKTYVARRADSPKAQFRMRVPARVIDRGDDAPFSGWAASPSPQLLAVSLVSRFGQTTSRSFNGETGRLAYF